MRLGLMIALAAQIGVARAATESLDYRPVQQVHGAVRVWGSDRMAGLLERWASGFRRFEPDVVIVANLHGTASAQFALQTGVADLALSGRQIYPYEYYGIYRRSQLYPREFAVATGSPDVRGKSTALGVFVPAANPLERLTLAQLDGIFGAERSGGWNAIVWDESRARGPEGNIRRWGQLGLAGRWAARPIHPYGPPGLQPGGVSFFQTRVLGGADTRNEDLVEYADRSKMLAALARDPDGIAYAPLAWSAAGVKLIALSEGAGAPVYPTRATIGDRSYPLARSAYAYVAPDTPTGDPAPIAGAVREFLRYILSREGQRAVADEGDYLPLTDGVLREQLDKLH